MLALLNNYPHEKLADGFRIRLGDLFGDEQREIVAELLVPGLRELGPHQVGTLVVELDQVVEPVRHHRIELPISINAVTPEQAPAAPDPEVEATANLLRVDDVRRALLDLIRQREFDQAQRRLAETRQQFAARGGLTPEVEREFERIADELRLAQHDHETGLKQMHFQSYLVTTGKGEYRRKSFDLARERAVTGMRGLLQVQTATQALEVCLHELDGRLQPALAECGVRAVFDVGYWSVAQRMLRAEPPQGVLTVAEEAELSRALWRSSRGEACIIFGPWGFADGHFSRWYAESQTALVATHGFTSLTDLPLAAFLAYEMLLHGLRAYPGYDPDGLMHEETRGCLFDLCRQKRDITRKLREGLVCTHCAPRLAQTGVPLDGVHAGLGLITDAAGGAAAG